ncbi:MAG: glycoside hydrolase family 9 protein [Bacteroidales bacterium]|nr:glycoside hydrolase family 9 protein [Bacteroidales bacterium]
MKGIFTITRIGIFFYLLSLFSCKTESCDKSFLKDELNGHEFIRLNQVGYFSGSIKKFAVVETGSSEFFIYDTTGKEVYKGLLKDEGHWAPSNENIKTGDFTDFIQLGKYTIYVPGKGRSYAFEISNDLYTNSLTRSLKTYYFQRASLELEEKFAGIYKRPLGQPDTMVYFHNTTGVKEVKGKRLSKNGSKGWYDAGDLNKYIVNAGVTVGMMYVMYNNYQTLFQDSQLNIPESGNGVSDLLDEIRWEMDWVLTMQDPDGGVYHKLSELDWQWAVMPHMWNDKERFFIGKSTASALNFVSMCAMTARVFRNVDSAYANKNLAAAKKAWDWSMKNPNVLAIDGYGVNSGAYDDKDLKDEFVWAASEMYVTTSEQVYLEYLNANIFNPKFEVCAWRTFMSNIGYYSLLSNESKLEQSKKDKIKNDFIALANNLVDTVNASPYGLPSSIFEWGSNSEMLNRAILISFAYELTKDKKYLDATVRMMDYILGNNAIGITYVTGEGSNYPLRPHHRQCFADGIDEPIPGFLVGGPNFKREDDVDKHCPSCKTDYLKEFPATSYVDHFHSYASNEVTINWNASYAYILSVIQAHKDELIKK